MLMIRYTVNRLRVITGPLGSAEGYLKLDKEKGGSLRHYRMSGVVLASRREHDSCAARACCGTDLQRPFPASYEPGPIFQMVEHDVEPRCRCKISGFGPKERALRCRHSAFNFCRLNAPAGSTCYLMGAAALLADDLLGK